MKLSQIDLNLFVVFDAVYTEQNLTRAAERLHLTQPAVSNALNRLRASLDDPLFVRTPRGMRPTPVAHNLIEPVRVALRNLDFCLQQQDRFDPAASNRRFRINASDIAEVLLLPQLIRALEAEAPGLQVEVGFTDRRQTALDLAAGDLDVAIDAPLLTHAELSSTALLREEYVCVLRKDHPACAAMLSLDHYLALRHLHISSRSRGMGQVDLALRTLGRRRQIALRLQHYAAAAAVVRASDLALSVPRRVAADWSDVVRLPLPFETPPLELSLFWHKSVEHDPATRWLRSVVARVVAALPAAGEGG